MSKKTKAVEVKKEKKPEVEIQPLNDLIIVERLEADKRTDSGIVIPDNHGEVLNEGIVISIGSGRLTNQGDRVPTELTVGDHVVFGVGSGCKVKINEDPCSLCGNLMWLVLSAVNKLNNMG